VPQLSGKGVAHARARASRLAVALGTELIPTPELDGRHARGLRASVRSRQAAVDVFVRGEYGAEGLDLAKGAFEVGAATERARDISLRKPLEP
jgi:hypothetical protein